jgi:hypothetical protein
VLWMVSLVLGSVVLGGSIGFIWLWTQEKSGCLFLDLYE